MNIEKQISHWRNGAADNFQFATECVERGRLPYGLFFAHLAIEKILKAHVIRETRDYAPKTHNLVRLAELASIPFAKEQIEFLRDFNVYQLETRYPEESFPAIDPATAESDMQSAKEILAWLTKLL